MTDRNFEAQANALRDEMVAQRRDFHRHPELGFEELRTAGVVARELTQLGLEVQTGVGKTGVVGILEGTKPGPTVLVRADMDALPIEEENAVDYASTAPGKMHACGHDGHTTIALTVAKLLSPHRDSMSGRVKFVFQPAEEIGLGAKAMKDDGVLTDLHPDVSLGLHLWTQLPMGTLAVPTGPIMAGASRFNATVIGKGGHGAIPYQTHDPIVCAAQLVTAWQTIISRNIDAMDSLVLSVTSIKSGDTYNVIPQRATLKGTFRFFKPEYRDFVVARMQAIGDSICAAFGCEFKLDVTHQVGPVVNDGDVSEQVRSAFATALPSVKLDTDYRIMASEDMSEFMTDIPGMFFFVGAGGADAYAHHHPRFDLDEDCLPMGAALMASAVASYVLPD